MVRWNSNEWALSIPDDDANGANCRRLHAARTVDPDRSCRCWSSALLHSIDCRTWRCRMVENPPGIRVRAPALGRDLVVADTHRVRFRAMIASRRTVTIDWADATTNCCSWHADHADADAYAVDHPLCRHYSSCSGDGPFPAMWSGFRRWASVSTFASMMWDLEWDACVLLIVLAR